MSAKNLHALARAVGLAPDWHDYRGQVRMVSDDALRRLLEALGRPAGTAGETADSLAQAQRDQGARAPLATAVRASRISIKTGADRARLILEHGGRRDVRLRDEGGGFASFRVPDQIGYHALDFGDENITLAVAPTRARRPYDLTGRRRSWGAAVQLYSLNEGGEFGDFGDLGRFAAKLALYGADAVAVSPTHALFTSDLDRYAPYGPSTRLFLNPLYADQGGPRHDVPSELIDWRQGGEAKIARLRQDYEALPAAGEQRAAFDQFVRQGGKPLLSHARFEALDHRFRPRGIFHWRDWPEGFSDVNSRAVETLCASDPQVELHLYLQWRVALSAAAAQAEAKHAGMAVGLISDLAVGMDGAGSHAWSRPQDILQGVSIGAPPDLLAPRGQSWGLTTFSPTALRVHSYEPFLATLRAALRYAGGVRIDHAIGLQHLWITPDGFDATEGAYMDYPFEDLLRLTALESARHDAIIIGEDLGTIPPGFRERSTRAGVEGMRVLWFEQTPRGAFRSPGQWGREAAAMTTTHDLPTVAGWWRGRDIEWRAVVDGEPVPASAKIGRKVDAGRLWKAMVKSGAAAGPQPAPSDTAPAVDAAITHVAASQCDLALIAAEDILGLSEQPNVPGPTTQHPNWRRRLPAGNGLDNNSVLARLRRLGEIRPRTL